MKAWSVKYITHLFYLQTIFRGKKKKKPKPREKENRPPSERERLVTWTRDQLHRCLGRAFRCRSSKAQLHRRFALFLLSSLCHPCHWSTLFLSTHVEQTTARQATHRDPVASAASRLNPVASLSSFSQFDRIWWFFFFGFCFFWVCGLRNDIIYLFGS